MPVCVEAVMRQHVHQHFLLLLLLCSLDVLFSWLLKHSALLCTESWHGGGWRVRLGLELGGWGRVGVGGVLGITTAPVVLWTEFLNELSYAMLTGYCHHTPTHNSQRLRMNMQNSKLPQLNCGFIWNYLCIIFSTMNNYWLKWGGGEGGRCFSKTSTHIDKQEHLVCLQTAHAVLFPPFAGVEYIYSSTLFNYFIFTAFVVRNFAVLI